MNRIQDLWPKGDVFESLPLCSEFYPQMQSEDDDEDVSDEGSTGLESPMRRFTMKSLPRNPDGEDSSKDLKGNKDTVDDSSAPGATLGKGKWFADIEGEQITKDKPLEMQKPPAAVL